MRSVVKGNIKLNAADKVLCFAAAVFAAALMVHIHFPEGNVFADGFLFVAEAALVGGMADWFAVTALFEKPLGFPWHTAILPKRREQFINASVAMIQKQFFSKRNMISHVEKLHLLPALTEWLNKEETRTWLLGEVSSYAKNFFCRNNAELSGKIRGELLKIPATDLTALLGEHLQKSGADRRLLQKIGR